MNRIRNDCFRGTALLCALLVAPGTPGNLAFAQAQNAPPAAAAPADKVRSPEQLDSLVAPIALYPDPLLAQLLAASTYPLEVVQAQRWLKSNSTLKGEELTKAAAKQPWDASIQAMVAFPDVLKRLDENLQWTTDLGNAFLDQQEDVMKAIQRLRLKAKDSGKLQTTKEQKVETQVVEKETVVVIQPSNPQVIYVPTYNPVAYWPPPPMYPYPPMVYPPYTAGAVVATAAISFGVGVAMGAFWGGCCGGHGYGWGCSWGNNANITINNNFNTRYNYNNVNNIQGGNRVNAGNTVNRGNSVGSGNSSWKHDSSHRRAVPYSSSKTGERFGGTARTADGRTERFDGRGNSGQRGSNAGVSDRSAGNRGGNVGGGNAGQRGGGAGVSDRSAGGGDRVGNRSVGDRSPSSSAFGGADSRSRTQAASDRGFSSERSSRSAGSSSARSSSSGGGFSGGGASSRSSGGGASRGGGGGRRR